MTDSSSLFITNPLSTSNPVTAVQSLQSPLPNGSLSDPNQQDEEEYTIKCICSYADDDGNTVYCPKCDTWQHIECYYPSKKVPEDHFCADCLPRDLDAKRATERQRRHREAIDGGDRKVKRPTTKQPKKKHKDSNAAAEQINGWHLHERHDSLTNGRDQPPPAKKPKTSHRTSGSVVSVNGESRKRASSNMQSYPSPSKSPQDLFRYPHIPTYTSEFLDLYDRDEGQTDAHGNEHTIQALRQLSSWRKDPSLAVSGDTQPSAKSPFVRADRPLEEIQLPGVTVETIEKKELEFDGKYPTWRTIRTRTTIKKDELAGEVMGEVGILEEYCLQKSSLPNRWQELRHPDPFVFFHPHMSIYVDSRRKGTQFRYLRRSCRPNVTLKTFVSDDGECRHFFVAREDIDADTELTAAWFLDPSMFQNSDLTKEDQEQQHMRQCDWVSRVLANFGDCACDDGEPCLFSRFDRRYPTKPVDAPPKEKIVRKRKNKSKHAISPMSTGQATNSRAGSEALKQDDEDHFDHRSTTGSSHSPPNSRDLTPVNVAALDADPVLGNGLTAREMRKIQAVERIFEQGQSQQRKKKRTSGGSTMSTPNMKQSMAQNSPYSLAPGSVPNQSSGSPPPKSTIGRHKGVTPSAMSQSNTGSPPRPEYRSIAIQTDEEQEHTVVRPMKRRKFMTPTQRLLHKVIADRERYKRDCANGSPCPSSSGQPTTAPVPSTNDVEMKDVAIGVSPVASAKSPSPSEHSQTLSPTTSPTYPLPSQAAHSHKQFKVPVAPKLQLATLPPVPVFPNNTSSGTTPNSGSTPLGASPPIQSPLTLASGNSYLGLNSVVFTPSPAKKKLSLGDYMSRRNLASTPVSEKTQAQSVLGMESDDSKDVEMADVADANGSTADSSNNLRPSESIKQEAAAQGGLTGSAIDDTPVKDDSETMKENSTESTTQQTQSGDQKKSEVVPAVATGVSSEVTQVLAQLAQINARHQSATST